jgi:hypothetical protein
MSIVHNVMDRLFGAAEEINGADRCATYMYRWTILRTRWGKLYVHRFVGDDWSRDLHDHPKRFLSVGLWGRYRETFWCAQCEAKHSRKYTAPWVRTFPAEHRHRLSLIDAKPCWTLIWVGNPERMWGFWHDGRFIHWEDYVKGSESALADKMKACD